MVPILDVANHSSLPESIIPRPRQVPFIKKGPFIPGRTGFKLLSPDQGMVAGEQVLFQYGTHSNDLLFAEYGFIEEGGIHGSVEVEGLVRELWEKCDGQDEKEAVLKSVNCWGYGPDSCRRLCSLTTLDTMRSRRILHLVILRTDFS